MKFYLVAFNKDIPEDNVLSIVQTKSQAKTYIVLHILNKHKEHFNAWCDIHNKNKDSFQVQFEYVCKVWYQDLEDYIVLEKKFNKKEMMHCLRILSGAIPVGAYWENEDEILVHLKTS